jgi:hypothetical protein
MADVVCAQNVIQRQRQKVVDRFRELKDPSKNTILTTEHFK